MASVSLNTNNQIQNNHNNPTNSNLFDRVGKFAKKIFDEIKNKIQMSSLGLAIVLVRLPIINNLASLIPRHLLPSVIDYELHPTEYLRDRLMRTHRWS